MNFAKQVSFPTGEAAPGRELSETQELEAVSTCSVSLLPCLGRPQPVRPPLVLPGIWEVVDVALALGEVLDSVADPVGELEQLAARPRGRGVNALEDSERQPQPSCLPPLVHVADIAASAVHDLVLIVEGQGYELRPNVKFLACCLDSEATKHQVFRVSAFNTHQPPKPVGVDCVLCELCHIHSDVWKCLVHLKGANRAEHVGFVQRADDRTAENVIFG
eukprot:CAMPEP_0202830280 /NCGR_PEP_ID=MMETSP1389-20130828/16064_1 /ASSEMBLY_ACC=CAM_ASM_000865 /TAXON_ID=302021 /ORGANISM="Rhodomonas sp., Strain CCMP768" /LENGTH=218 /DNA_ID=CAMNT_0049503907 /DNA_START=95 /DNA_END=752 /DNA_ORIENTATION=-